MHEKITRLQTGKWIVFLAIAAMLGWRIVTLNLSAYYSDRTADPDYTTALSWHSSNPEALFQQGRRLIASNPDAGETLLRQAAFANPADGRMYVTLAQQLDKRGETDKAAELIAIADRLAPRRSDVQQEIALFWLRKGRIDKGIEPLTLVLEARPQLRKAVYPGLLQVVESPAGRAEVAKALESSPSWWPGFFAYVINNAGDPNTIRELYRLSTANGRSLGRHERRRYLAWLQRQNLWREAHALWSNALDDQQRQALGLIYDGDFEQPISNEGFGWQAPQVRGVEISTLRTYGVKGANAVRVVFLGHRPRFRHLFQYLVLPPGRYELQGKGRADNLEAEYGLQWTLRCATGDQPVLGTSEAFRGISDWRQFQLAFEIPDQGCDAQVLRLELIGRVARDFETRGAVWFDDFTLQRQD